MILNNAEIALEDEIINGSLAINDGKISYITNENIDGIDCRGLYIGPGFVDVHCHGGLNYWFFDEPIKAAQFHLQHGTTTILASLWRNAVKKGIIDVVKAMAAAIEGGEANNLAGIHIEGPYINPALGSEGGESYNIDEKEYKEIISAAKGHIKQWTFDPTKEDSEKFAQCCFKNDIKLGICYSNAAPAEILKYLKYGLKIGNHIMCGTGKPKTRFEGTIEAGSDEYVLSSEDMYAEVICDSIGAHVRNENLKIIYRCKSADRIMLITDNCADGDSLGSDVNIIDGELYGSHLTMNIACRNMRKHTNASLVDIFKMASTTPAEALGFENIGKIEKNYFADLVICDEQFNIYAVLKNGDFVKNDLCKFNG